MSNDEILYTVPIKRKTFWFTSPFLDQVNSDFAEIRKVNPRLLIRKAAVIEVAYSISREQAIQELKERVVPNT